MKRFAGSCVPILFLLAALPAHADVCRVTTAGDDAATGSDWSSPTTLKQAVKTAACTEIWVAKGVYTPVGNSAFSIKPAVAVYGGFAGTETSRTQRDPAANLTVLSGDIDGDDTDVDNGDGIDVAVSVHNADNSARIVQFDDRNIAPVTPTTVLDGFTITGATLAGVFCNGNGVGGALPYPVCDPTLSNLVFSGNAGSALASALTNDGRGGEASPVLFNVTFRGNSAPEGGAMYNNGSTNGKSNPALTNVTFVGNSATQGGAILNDSRSGGVASPVLTNVTFSGNSATDKGGAMANILGGPATNGPKFVNTILWNDSATTSDAEIYTSAATSGFTVIDHSIVSGGCPAQATCTNLIGGDPQLGTLSNNGGSTLTLLPGQTSIAIDAGSDANCPSVDQRNVRRAQDLHCDVGAVEAALVASVDAVGGSGQQTETWTTFFNPLTVQVHDPYGLVAAGVAVFATSPASGQPGATCSDGYTDDSGTATIYCRANGGVGGPYAVDVHAAPAQNISPAVFLLTNTPSADIIFRDDFDVPGPRTN